MSSTDWKIFIAVSFGSTWVYVVISDYGAVVTWFEIAIPLMILVGGQMMASSFWRLMVTHKMENRRHTEEIKKHLRGEGGTIDWRVAGKLYQTIKRQIEDEEE